MSCLALGSLLLLCLFGETAAFSLSRLLTGDGAASFPVAQTLRKTQSRTPVLRMHFAEALAENKALTSESLLPERYVATNRFKVRPGKGPAFEKRWADRKSRLAELDGFRFFALLRRTEAEGVDYSSEGDFGNYVSFTVWEDKEAFEAWRTGDAFKEAHGGGGIMSFIQLLSTALFIVDGAPKPAFYDALIPVPGERLDFASDGGWRTVKADGETALPGEIFVSQNRFSVRAGKEAEFEQKWKQRESKLKESDGFVGFLLLRRDATKADDGYNYMVTTIWRDRAAFSNWRSSAQFKAAHANASPPPPPVSDSADSSSSSVVPPTSSTPEGLYLGPPKLRFFEGVLTLSSQKGV
uniref:ABM domain-containing protein n=1 Tax=Chromera velia CCMP2878 TaxID=1169474 RepID=A0A0G4IF81_9ALVE|eukprot:Cvel_13902.t1-p1 / transcript=Cvel_13902.t1 / gene=Cvel_13902 / organism=Chromera_velia_CCMP2878 / gene_product=hypothetical protein / transcript_product=hypothetical protein / location=Cvel_scaffold968:43385-44440(-) / protein_length=352 / sequence_SO=supercontig / SO=protein_coding / is_pseudo=false